MPVVASWDGVNRHIHLASGVTSFHPVDDIYREYREERRTNEAFRVWEPFMRAVGNEPKGGGKFTPRYLLLLQGAKIVPFDEDNIITVEGEVLTDDQTDPVFFETLSPGTTVVMNFVPPTSEIIAVGTSGLTPEESQALTDIDTNVTTLTADVSDLGDGVFGQKVLQDSADKTVLPGYMILWDEVGTLLGHKEIYEAHVLAGDPANIGYTRAGRGIAFEGALTAGMPPP
jgi:hypothetical protein